MIIIIPVTHVVVHYQQGTFDQHPWLKLDRKHKTQQHVLHLIKRPHYIYFCFFSKKMIKYLVPYLCKPGC